MKARIFLKSIAAGLVTALLSTAANADFVYMRSTVGPPWGVNTNEQAMNTAFGGGNWSDLRYETVNANLLFGNSDRFIFMEGGDSNANEMEAFLTANNALISAFVNAGGSIFMNAAPNEGDGMSYGFGVNLIYNPGPFCASNCNAVDPTHPIFNGLLPTALSFGGTFFSHSIVGGGLISLIEDASNNVLLGEMSVGLGHVMFGGMTTTNFHNPQPAAFNLRVNILDYAANQVNAVEPATLALLGLGLVGLGVARRRRAA